MFLAFNLKNLSAYQEITIQKDSNLQNYQELLLRINNSITEEDIISVSYTHLTLPTNKAV